MAITYFDTVNGEIISEYAGTTQHDYLSDALGSVTGVCDQTGSSVGSAAYAPYGATLSTSGTQASFGWNGGWGYRPASLVNAEFYVEARHYTSSDGCWTTVDPLWPSEAAYGYVGSAPTCFADPSGLQRRGPKPGPHPPVPKPAPPAPPATQPGDPWWLVPLHCLGKVAGVVGLALTPTSTSSSDDRYPAKRAWLKCSDYEGRGGTTISQYDTNLLVLWKTIVPPCAKGVKGRSGTLSKPPATQCENGGVHWQQPWNCGCRALFCDMLCCNCAQADGSEGYACFGGCKPGT